MLGGPCALAETARGYHLPVADQHGRTVHLWAEETGRGAPIVLLHGLGASTYMWRHVVAGLARTHRVIALDLKGFGRSSKTFDTAYAPHDHAVLVADFLRRRGLSDVTLVGHSLGGVVALLVAMQTSQREPHRVGRLVVMNTPALPQSASPAVGFLKRPVLPYLVLNIVPPELPAALALFTEAIGMSHITERDVQLYGEPLRDVAGRHALIQTARQIEPINAEEVVAQYRRVRQRTLVVGCRNDRTVPIETAVRLSRLLPRSRLVVLDDCDHIPPEQSPATVIALLRASR